MGIYVDILQSELENYFKEYLEGVKFTRDKRMV